MDDNRTWPDAGKVGRDLRHFAAVAPTFAAYADRLIDIHAADKVAAALRDEINGLAGQKSELVETVAALGQTRDSLKAEVDALRLEFEQLKRKFAK